MNKFLVLTPPRTGSTLLVNIVHGFFAPDKPVSIVPLDKPISIVPLENLYSKSLILKSHNLKLLSEECLPSDVFIIIAERPEINKVFPEKFNKSKLSKNVLPLDYKTDLLYKSDYGDGNSKDLIDVIKNIAKKIESKFDILISGDQINGALERILKMNKRYEEIKSLPFSKYDEFYHLHGSHRQRKD